MKPTKNNLEKSSFLFMQLGLVLALLVTYTTLELETEKRNFVINEPYTERETDVFPLPTGPIIIEKTKDIEKVTPKKKKKKLTLEKIDLKKDNDKTVETVLDTTVFNDDPKTDINQTLEGLPDITDVEPDDVIDFVHLESVPVFPGCENLNNLEAKKCFTKEITKFVNKKFDTDVASGLSLYGKQRIFVQFVVNKNGDIDNIRVNAPHKRLEKEATRIVNKLPKMIPGKQRNIPVSVKYTLPIRFEIQN